MYISKVENYVLPRGWSWCYLADFTDIVMGQSPTSDTYNKNGDGIPFFQGKAEFGAIYPTVAKYCNAPNKIGLPGATLLSVRAPVGPTNLVKERCCIGRGLAAIHPIGGISSMFVLYLLRSIETDLLKEGTGSTFAAINKQFVEELEFGLPPLPEQHRIVAKIEELFSELDKGIENLKTARAQLKVYRQALLKHAFEGKLTTQWRVENRDKLETAAALLKRIQLERAQRYQQKLADWEVDGKRGSKPKSLKALPPLTVEELDDLPELPEGWAWARFGLLDIELKRGPFGSSITKSMFVLSGFKVYEQGNAIYRNATRGNYFIDSEKYDELSGFIASPGDFIVSCAGTVGRIFELPPDAPAGVINQALMRMRINETILNQSFFAKLFESGFFQRKVLSDAKGTAMVNLAGIKELNLVPVAICGMSEQEVINELLEAHLSEVDQLDQTITTSLQQAEALRQSILKKAFSGQLVPQDPHDEPASILLARIKAEKSAQSNNKKMRT